MTKRAIRKFYLRKRKVLKSEEIFRLSEHIFQNFIAEFRPAENQKVHCFLSISDKDEVNTEPFLNYFFDRSVQVFVPKLVEGQMLSIQIDPDVPLIKNAWGIPEPEGDEDSGEKDFDFVLVPLLYCDHHGNRVGYGKGFYDQFFTEISSRALKIGLNFFNPAEEISDLWEKDVALDYLVTPTAVLSFGSGTSKFTK